MTLIDDLISPALSEVEEPLVQEQIALAKLYDRLGKEGESPSLRDEIEAGEERVNLQKKHLVQVLDARKPDPLDQALDEAIAVLEGRPKG